VVAPERPKHHVSRPVKKSARRWFAQPLAAAAAPETLWACPVFGPAWTEDGTKHMTRAAAARPAARTAKFDFKLVTP
jgi:hypothetical protein